MGTMFVVDATNQLVELQQTPYESEKFLQELLATHPGLLGGEGDERRRLALIRREVDIPDHVTGKGRWSLDHLFIDGEGVPVFVEVKKASNNQLRREVVGQMLDYAANAVKYWNVTFIRAQFARTQVGDEVDEAEALCRAFGENVEPDDFWKRVETNLQARRIRMVFVADEIPDELRSIVEFLNEQMNPAEVIAVEVGQFVGGGLRTLVPKVIGETSKAQAVKSANAPERPENWAAVLDWVENEDIKPVIKVESERRKSNPRIRKIYYEAQGAQRWRIQVQKQDANIWQWMRFEGDVEYWRRLFPSTNVRTPNDNKELSFNLNSGRDLERFRDAVLTDGAGLKFSDRGEPGPPA